MDVGGVDVGLDTRRQRAGWIVDQVEVDGAVAAALIIFVAAELRAQIGAVGLLRLAVAAVISLLRNEETHTGSPCINPPLKKNQSIKIKIIEIVITHPFDIDILHLFTHLILGRLS
jgi:hypothetical protein